jgi:hypothetical protein
VIRYELLNGIDAKFDVVEHDVRSANAKSCARIGGEAGSEEVE